MGRKSFSGILVVTVCFLAYTQPFQVHPKNSEVEVVPVVIQGAGVNAGTYYVPHAMRVFDIVKMASPETSPDFHVINCRSVAVTTGSSTETLDLLRYLHGDISHNPFIMPGSHISLVYAVQYVYLYGEVQGSLLGQIPLKADESAGELLSLFTFTRYADSSNIILYRIGEERKQYSLSEIADKKLIDGDFIIVLPKRDMPRPAKVTVGGEAAVPGVYPIIHGETTLAEIMEQAGGASQNGDISRAYLLRRAKMQKKLSELYLKDDNMVRPEVLGGLEHLVASHDYAIIPGSKSSTVIENGDEIIVPSVEQCVFVSGSVEHPGGYPYQKGRGTHYYIKAAGGFTRSADKQNVKVMTPYIDGIFSLRTPQELQAGDILMVPEAKEDKWIKKWTPVIGVAATVITTISIIVGLTD